MIEKDIIRLAEEAELWLHSDRKYEAVEKFANLVAAEEREACAKVCDAYDVAEDVNSSDTAEGIAIAIRARGQHD